MKVTKQRKRSGNVRLVFFVVIISVYFSLILVISMMMNEGSGHAARGIPETVAQPSQSQMATNIMLQSQKSEQHQHQASIVREQHDQDEEQHHHQQQEQQKQPALFASLPESPLIIKQTDRKISVNDWSPTTEKPTLEDWPRLVGRLDIVKCIQKLGGTTGVEIGVQRGRLAWRSLQIWTNCKAYKLVDLWGSEANYVEPGADSNARKNQHLRAARKILTPYSSQVEFYVMRSSDAAAKFENDYFDYIYVDARHDYCAVLEDMEHYWPKLKAGGIMAGHDFVDAAFAMSTLGPHEDWSKCEDGTVNVGAVKGAVLDFAVKHGNLRLLVTTEQFPSWVLQKPYE